MGVQYVYAESSLRLVNETARLVSPVYPPDKSLRSCLKFAFHLHGADMGSLEVGQQDEEDTTDMKVLGKLSGNYQDDWQIFLVDLIPVNKTFQLYLEASVGRSYLSDIAVDDLELLQDIVEYSCKISF